VRDQEAGFAVGADDAGKIGPQRARRDVIKLAEGFVEQHQLGVDGERARERDALPHAAQELVDIFPLRALQADAREPCGRLATRLGRRDAEDEQTEFRVLDGVAPGQQAIGLEADRELAAQHLERALKDRSRRPAPARRLAPSSP
jgi:hypothetical protein